MGAAASAATACSSAARRASRRLSGCCSMNNTVAPSTRNGTMASKRAAEVCSSSCAPTMPPATLGIVKRSSQRRVPSSCPR